MKSTYDRIIVLYYAMDPNVDNIKAIHKDTVNKICSGQVVLSLAVAVKELVENALDAGATNIEIRLKKYGTDLIEVSDNGVGITEENFTALTLKYHTSKLNEYSDLLGVTSFGFRGEALSSLCSLANVVITSRHKNSEYATKIEYDHKGIIVKQTPCSRQVGTTVTLTNLFYSLPVRQKEFHKNAKREFHKMINLLYAYCLISLGVKITCSNQTSTNSKALIVATQGSQTYKDNIACVFGVKQLQSIMEIKTENVNNIKDNIFKGLLEEASGLEDTVEVKDIEIDLSEDSNDAENFDDTVVSSSQKSQGYKNVTSPILLTGFISSCAHGCGRSSTDRQYYYVNSRPCEPTKVAKLVNEIYKQYNPHQYPFILLNISLDRDMVDVNVTPDKRKIFLTKEKIILDVIKYSLLKMFESIPRILKVESTGHGNNFTQDNVKSNVDQPRIFNSFLQQFDKNNSRKDSNKSIEINHLKRKSTSLLDSFLISKNKKADIEIEKNISIPYDKSNDAEEEKDINFDAPGDIKLEPREEEKEFDIESLASDNGLEPNNSKIEDDTKAINIVYLNYTSQLPKAEIVDINDFLAEESHSYVCKTKSKTLNAKSVKDNVVDIPPKINKTVTDKEDLGKYDKRFVTLKTSLEHVTELTKCFNDRKTKPSDLDRVKFKSVINPVFNKKCEEELTREISKDSFKNMKVIGQFNLGFIITQLGDDLFIIDQHATDEIYNFETLQKTTELTSQKLVIPQQLELTSVNEQILIDNLKIFKKNGFTFEINEDADPTKKVKLLTLPMSKNWIFGKDDIDELLFMLRENPAEHCRPSRVRAMFASRACRKSVMIGTALSNADMKKLVDHMGEIDKPWNCPHGRPTIRHLVNLAMVLTSSDLNYTESSES